MAFEKGKPRAPTAGRKKGSLNKSKILKVSDYLSMKDINPVDEIMKLMRFLEERDRARLWMDLLSYCQAKPNIYIEDDAGDESEDLADKFKHASDEALILIAGGKKEIS